MQHYLKSSVNIKISGVFEPLFFIAGILMLKVILMYRVRQIYGNIISF